MAEASASNHGSRGDLRAWSAALLLVLFALALRAHGLTAGGLHLDEGYSLIQSERSLFDIFRLNRFDANPPFYLVTLHLWRSLFGDGEWALKSLSMFAGGAGVLGVWLAARERFGLLAGCAAAFFTAANAFHIQHAQEIRGYSVLFAAVAFADFAFVRWQRTARPRALLGWGIAAFYAVNIHHFAWYFVAVQGLAGFLQPRAAAQRRPLALAFASLLLASSPMLASFVVHLLVHQSQSWIPLRDLANLFEILATIGGWMPVAPLVWGLALLGALVCARPRKQIAAPETIAASPPLVDRLQGVGVPVLQLLLPLWLFVGSQLFFPMLLPRYCVIALLPLALLAGAGVASLRPRPIAIVVVAAFAVLSLEPVQTGYANEKRLAHLQAWADAVEAGYREGDVVLYTDKYIFVPAIALHPGEMDEYLLPELAGRNRSSVLAHYTAREVRRPALEPEEYQRLWIVKRPAEKLANVLRDPMFARVTPRMIRRLPDSEVYLFSLDDDS